MADLARLRSFGDIAAENYFRPEFFVQSRSWERVRAGERPIVIGRKGTGKTALRLALLNEASGSALSFAADLNFRDYPWTAHHLVYGMEVGHRSRYVETWQFLMLVELAKLAVGEDQDVPAHGEAAESAAAIRKFVEDNWGRLRFDITRYSRDRPTRSADRWVRKPLDSSSGKSVGSGSSGGS